MQALEADRVSLEGGGSQERGGGGQGHHVYVGVCT